MRRNPWYYYLMLFLLLGGFIVLCIASAIPK